MSLVILANFSASSLSASGLMNSPILQQLIGDEMLHAFFSTIRKSKKPRLSRAGRRKVLNRKRRWFTDNIIMHHKRLHDRNRQITVSQAREQVQMGSKSKKRMDKQEPGRWRDRVEIRDRGRIIRGRIDNRRSRARSRWLSVADVSIG